MTVLTGTDKPPSRRQLHLLADFVELRCASSESGAFSAEELQDARKRADQDAADDDEVSVRELFLEEEAVLDPAIEAAIGLDEPEDEPEVRIAPDDPGEAVGSPGIAAEDDVREIEAADVVRHLAYRAATFGAAYPFLVRRDAVLELREDLNGQQWLYLTLLVASNLKHVRSKADRNRLTTYFELLAPTILRGHLGSNAIVELFGTTTTEAPGRYAGSLWEKLQVLKDDIRLPLLARQGQDEIDDANVGDHGVDAVAWFPFSDRASNIVTVLAQSACGRGWPSKMREPTEENWNRVFAFYSPVVNTLLIPYCFRQPDGSWYSDAKVKKGVLLDRARIFEALPDDADLPAAADAWPRDVLEQIVRPSPAEPA